MLYILIKLLDIVISALSGIQDYLVQQRGDAYVAVLVRCGDVDGQDTVVAEILRVSNRAWTIFSDSDTQDDGLKFRVNRSTSVVRMRMAMSDEEDVRIVIDRRPWKDDASGLEIAAFSSRVRAVAWVREQTRDSRVCSMAEVAALEGAPLATETA